MLEYAKPLQHGLAGGLQDDACAYGARLLHSLVDRDIVPLLGEKERGRRARSTTTDDSDIEGPHRATLTALAISFPLPNRRETKRFAQRLARTLGPGDLVLLDGPLGAGKTFFVRALLRALGVSSQERVTSPTFTLVHQYETTPRVLHADLYRLKSASELWALDLAEERSAGASLLVEWGLPYASELGGDALILALSVTPSQTAGSVRALELRASGERSQQMLELLAAGFPGLAPSW